MKLAVELLYFQFFFYILKYEAANDSMFLLLYHQLAEGIISNYDNERTPKLTDTPQTRHYGLVSVSLSIVKNSTAIGDTHCIPHTEMLSGILCIERNK